MTRSLLTLTALAAALALAGCASQSSSSKPAASAAASSAPALSDAAVAAKLKGNWSGNWTLPGFGGGKFELVATQVNGTTVTGNANWYGTANGDIKAPLGKAVVQNGTLSAEQPGTTFKLSLKGDNELSGTWNAAGYSGPLTAKRQ